MQQPKGSFAFPHHFRISSCDQAGTAMGGFVYGSAIRYSTELRLRESSVPCPRRRALTTWGMAGSHRCWMTSWKDISLTQRHLAMHVPPKRDW